MEKKAKRMDEAIFEFVSGMPPVVGKMILEEYYEMPRSVIKAIDDVYEGLEGMEGAEGLDEVKGRLARLKEVCEANPAYGEFYESVKAEVQGKIGEKVANEGLGVLGEGTE